MWEKGHVQYLSAVAKGSDQICKFIGLCSNLQDLLKEPWLFARVGVIIAHVIPLELEF